MRSLTRNVVGVCLIYVTLVGGFALWQREEIAAADRAAWTDAAHAGRAYDRAMRHLGFGAAIALALAGGLGISLYVLLVRRSREVADLLEAALAGRTLPVPQVKDEFAGAFAAADRVGQELHLERERGAKARQRLNTLSLLMDVGVLLVNSALQLEFANRRACDLLGCADPEELERRWGRSSIARRDWTWRCQGRRTGRGPCAASCTLWRRKSTRFSFSCSAIA